MTTFYEALAAVRDANHPEHQIALAAAIGILIERNPALLDELVMVAIEAGALGRVGVV